MPQPSSAFDARRARPREAWEHVIDLVIKHPDGAHRGFDRSPQGQALRELMDGRSPDWLGELVVTGAHQAMARPDARRALSTFLNVFVDHYLSKHLFEAVVYSIAQQTPPSQQKDVWTMVMHECRHPALAEHLMLDLPRMGLSDTVQDGIVAAFHPRDVGWALGRYGTPPATVDMLTRRMGPTQRRYLFDSPRLAQHMPDPAFTTLLLHARDDDLERLLAATSTGLNDDATRTQALDRIVAGVAPQRLDKILTSARQAQQDHAPGSPPPGWTVVLHDHLHRRPPTVSMEDLIREAEVLRDVAMAPANPVRPVPEAARRTARAPRAR